MKAKFILYSILMVISLTTFSQNEPVDLKTFTVPTLPAFTILNLGTQSINRPTNTKGVAASLLSSVNGNLINPNVAIEIAPFWLKSQNLNFDDYYKFNNEDNWKKSLGQNAWRNLAFSIATTKLGDNKDTLPGTRLGWGVRTKILEGHISNSDFENLFAVMNKTIDIKDIIHASLHNLDVSNVKNISDLKKIIGKSIEVVIAKSNFENNEEMIKCAKSKLEDIITDYLKKKPEKKENINDIFANIDSSALDKKAQALGLQNLQQTKVGLIWEIAAAGIQYFPTNTTDNSNFMKAGGWTLITYREEKQKDEFTALLRLVFSSNDSFTSYTDLGLGYNRIVSNDFTYGFEYVFRNQSVRYNTKDILGNDIKAIKSNGTYRFAMKLNYKLSDDINLNACIGKDFDGPITSSGNLLALLGINFSLPTKQTLKVN